MAQQDPEIAGVRITHPDRVLYPDIGLTKVDLARYYETVADRMLPHLIGRRLTLKQCVPDVGRCQFLRHTGRYSPQHVRSMSIREQKKVGRYMVVETVTALVSLAQYRVVELHTWNATANRLEQPDRLVFDLDPGPDVPWQTTVHAARDVRETLSELGLRSWVKTTGGKGLHVVVPIRPEYDWDTCLAVSRGVATLVASRDPSLYTLNSAHKAARAHQILIDVLRNNRTATSVAAFSARAVPGAPVSMPLAWEQLTPKLQPARFGVSSLGTRRRAGADAWPITGRRAKA